MAHNLLRIRTAVALTLCGLWQAAAIAQVQPVRPVSNVITLGFGASTTSSAEAHNGIDYQSSVGDAILSVGPGGTIAAPVSASAMAAKFGSSNPDGRGPAIWMEFTLVSGEPIYVVYGNTATTSTDYSSDAGTGSFQFNATYTVQWQPGNYVNANTVLGKTAPFYDHTVLKPHLHVGVFKPNKTCQNGTAYCTPPIVGWEYSPLHLPTGDFIDPDLFFTDPQYALQAPPTPADNSIFLKCPNRAVAGRTATCSVSVSFADGANATALGAGVRITPNGATPPLTSGRVRFGDFLGNGVGFGAGAVDTVAGGWMNLNPAISGTLTLGTVTFTVPVGANGSYAVSLGTIQQALLDDGSLLNLTVGSPATINVSTP